MKLSMSGRRSIAERVGALLAVVVLPLSAAGHDYVPGKPQQHPVLLKGGNLYTVSGPVLEATDLIFENGRITAIGRDLRPPEGAQVIDVTGQNVYPGLIAAYTSLGLTEIGAVRATNDISEVGAVTPEVNTIIAYNPDSELLPSVRSNGITTVQVVPGGALLRGRSSIVHLDGWTREDAAVKVADAMHLTWPPVRVVTAWWMQKTPEQQKKDMAEQRRRLRQLFEDARAYRKARQADPNLERDLRWEAMLPVLNKEMPLFIAAGDYRQIEQAVAFAEKEDLRIVIVGGQEAWKLTDLLRERNIPVVLFGPQRMPTRHDSDYDEPFREAARLYRAGVKFCLAQPAGYGSGSSWATRNLPFQAGMAVGYGLPYDAALRSITLSAAEILGIDKDYGSLEVGKSATIVVSEGDILDHLTHQVTHMWIDGRAVDLDNKHKELYRKYRQKPVPAQ